MCVCVCVCVCVRVCKLWKTTLGNTPSNHGFTYVNPCFLNTSYVKVKCLPFNFHIYFFLYFLCTLISSSRGAGDICVNNFGDFVWRSKEYNIWKQLEIFIMHVVDENEVGAPGWLSWLSVQVQLRSWSCSLWIWAQSQALCWQLRVWRLLWILCLLFSLCPSPAHVLPLSLKNK